MGSGTVDGAVDGSVAQHTGRTGLVEAAFIRACTLDVEVVKPGNVSATSPGHGMTAAHFLASAAAAAPAICATGAPVGRRILRAVEASWAAARCNTNLGILLLCAPIACALESIGLGAEPQALRRALRQVLQRSLQALTVDDATDAFRAIALANPGGLGAATDQDVHREPTVNLLAAMALAADRDMIARQYATGYSDLFDVGLPAWDAALARSGNDQHHAMQCVFLAFLAGFPDSHIARKHGTAAAEEVSRQAARWLERVLSDGSSAQSGLVQWDGRLKASGVNPGTSADLAVATAFAADTFVSRLGHVATRAG